MAIRAELVKKKAQDNASGGMMRRRTGLLADSVKVEPVFFAGETGFSIGTERPEGYWLNQGTKRHVIPKTPLEKDKWLFSAPGHPDPLLARHKSVNHPGTRPRPWLTDALEVVRL